MITEKKYILFDLDGTLTDPKVGICTCVQYALKEFGIEEPDLDKLEPFIGPPLKDSFMEFYGLSEEQAEAAIEKYRERFSVTGKFENQVYEGIPGLLKDLKVYGYQLAVASSKPECFVKDILNHFNIARHFDVVVGSELDGSRVDKAEVIQEALNRLFHYKAINKKQIIMIGDRKFDIEGAREIEVSGVAVGYGYGSEEELKAAEPDYLVSTVAGLRTLLIDEAELQKKYQEAAGKAEEQEKLRRLAAQKQNVPKVGLVQRIWKLVYPFLLFYMAGIFLRQMFGVGLMLLAEQNQWLYNFMVVAEGTTQEVWTLSGNGSAIIEILTMLGTFVVLYMLGNGKQYLAKKDSQKRVFKPIEWFGWIGLALTFAMGLNMVFAATGLLGMSEGYQETAKSLYAVSIPFGILLYGIFTPLAEELLFRGIIFNEVKKSMVPFGAALLSASLFGVYHGNSIQMFYSFCVGIILAYGYQYSERFLVPVVIHGAVNICVFLASNYELFQANTIQLILGLILTALSVVWFYILKKHYESKETKER